MKLVPTAIKGIAVAETSAFTDHRGSFTRLFCERELADAIGARRVVQINHSRTLVRGAIRGMHYQHPPHSEMKLVRCIRGSVWDVGVDLRFGSPTFLRWHGEELTPQNARMLVIPEGCAHGFQVLEPGSELLYLHTVAYEPTAEGGIAHDDPRLAISWPLPAADVSGRDRAYAPVRADFSGIRV